MRIPVVLSAVFGVLLGCADDSATAVLSESSSSNGPVGISSVNGASSSVPSSSSVALIKSCKRGVAYGHHSAADMAAFAPGIRWWYNWYYSPDDGLGDAYGSLDVGYVPMWWGNGVSKDALQAGIPEGAVALLGFNEPNFGSQSDLSAEEAAALWPQLQAVADAKGLKLVSPAVNFCGGDCHSAGPVEYLNEFFAACTNCRVDYIAVHIYVGCSESDASLQKNRAQWLINHVEMYKAAFSQPIWLTEFACDGNPSDSEQKAFLEDAVAYLEQEPRIARYAWFSGRADNMTHVDLLGADGVLTELGRAYVNAPFDTTDCAME